MKLPDGFHQRLSHNLRIEQLPSLSLRCHLEILHAGAVIGSPSGCVSMIGPGPAQARGGALPRTRRRHQQHDKQRRVRRAGFPGQLALGPIIEHILMVNR